LLSPGRERGRTALRWLLAAAFLAAGYFHLADPRPFLRITPSWVPHPAFVIRATGLCELAGAAGLLVPRVRPVAAALLALYTVCVYPANVQHMLLFARSGAAWTGWLYHVPRLLFQPVILWWCLFAGRLIDWPFRSPGRAAPAPGPRPGPTG
jgi:uncharacterized membrane protein